MGFWHQSALIDALQRLARGFVVPVLRAVGTALGVRDVRSPLPGRCDDGDRADMQALCARFLHACTC